MGCKMYIEPAIVIRKKIIPESSNERMRMDSDEQAIKEEYHFEPITLEAIVQNDHDYVLVGESGIGKTSFLYWTASQIASKDIISGVIPLFLPLKDIAIIKTKNDLFSLLDTSV